MAEAGPGAAGGYVAFISYSHKDAAIGRWLHRKLEGYRLPRRLAGTQGEDGEVPERLTPIFRDRDEFPAAGDLSERVRAALSVSKNLIVLCSPNSAASPWVAKEIATFRELHPGRPVFTAIVDGEPGRSFSPALLEGGVEPLAADLRKEGDGRRLGLLKIVAGLAGVGLDALVQRDAARRVRRVTYVTAAAVTAMLAMALLTAFALNARAEAERQRAKAEGLVEFMLTDLRTKLRGVGRIDVMHAVNARALKHYGDGEDLRKLPADSLLRRARILRALGEDQEKLGDLDAALLGFREAHRTTAEQLARRPRDPALLLYHGQSEYGIGRIHELRREWPAAQTHYTRFAAATERLLAVAPDNPDYLMAAASASINLGNVQLNGSRNFGEAQRFYGKAIERFRLAAVAKPGDPNPLMKQADAYGWLADSFFMRGMWRESLNARLQQSRIAEQLLRSDPGNLDLTFRFALAQRAVASSFAKTGEVTEARPRLFAAYQLSSSLGNRDPRNAEWLLFRGMIGCELLYRGLGLPPGVDRTGIRNQVKSVAAALTAQRNPRAMDLERCLAAIAKDESLDN